MVWPVASNVLCDDVATNMLQMQSSRLNKTETSTNHSLGMETVPTSEIIANLKTFIITGDDEVTANVLCVIFLVLAICGAHWIRKKAGKEAEQSRGNRLPYVDNLRFILLIFIVLHHLDLNVNKEAQFSNPKLEFARWFTPEYPLVGFAMLSGMLSHGCLTKHKLRSVIETIALPYLVYECVAQPIRDLATGNSVTARTVMSDVVHGTGTAWYLQVLFWWRVLAFLIHDIASKTTGQIWPIWLVVLFASAARMVGEFEFPKPFDEATYFLPAFVFGQLFPVMDLVEIVPAKTWVTFTGIIALCVCWYSVCELQAGEIEKGPRYPYSPVYHGTDPLLRPGLYWSPVLLMCIMNLVILVSIVPRQQGFFTAHGGEGAMCIYLLQGLIFRHPLWAANLVKQVESLGGDYVLAAFQVLLAVAFACILGSRPVRTLAGPLLNFKWLGDLFFKKQSA